MQRSFVSLRVVFIALHFTLLTQLTTHSANIYRIIYASPTNLNSYAVDLNDHGLLLGTVADTNTHFHFTSLDGASPQIPQDLIGRTLRFLSYENQFAYLVTFTDSSSVTVQLEESGATNLATYTYRTDSDRSHLHIDLSGLQTRLEFQLQWTFLPWMPHDWRLTKMAPAGKTYFKGRFFASELFPRIRPVSITSLPLP